ncbi:DUF4224 domain-containing protein [Burkholderia multivorans]|nr:DUF4224 domain-containing protein [Burkholderia multivorans]MCA8440640.1 DUF4224 domain-containing protein [Burkholderia multivorans]
MFLSSVELAVLTGRKIKSKQIEALRRMGVTFLANACGRAIVARSAIEGRSNSAGRTESGGRAEPCSFGSMIRGTKSNKESSSSASDAAEADVTWQELLL